MSSFLSSYADKYKCGRISRRITYSCCRQLCQRCSFDFVICACEGQCRSHFPLRIPRVPKHFPTNLAGRCKHCRETHAILFCWPCGAESHTIICPSCYQSTAKDFECKGCSRRPKCCCYLRCNKCSTEYVFCECQNWPPCYVNTYSVYNLTSKMHTRSGSKRCPWCGLLHHIQCTKCKSTLASASKSPPPQQATSAAYFTPSPVQATMGDDLSSKSSEEGYDVVG